MPTLLLAAQPPALSATPGLGSGGEWRMAGANPQRTSWTPAEAPGALKEAWVKPIEPYISMKVQVIAANKTLFVSSSKGLYAFDSDTGAEKWVYATELPLGHSPTYDNGVVYAGGLDRKLHAIDAATGQGRWTFSASGGFQTNPLVVNGIVYLGSRDGYMYAVGASGTPQQGQLIWKFKAGGQILHSAAYGDNVLYFAAMDGHAYALDAATGAQRWKSAKLPGQGFHSWWPVIYRDKVVFTRTGESNSEFAAQDGWLFANATVADQIPGLRGNVAGDWAANEVTMDVRTNPVGNTIPDYFEAHPKRRAVFVLNQADGAEVAYDLDRDGTVDAAPVMQTGKTNTLYPPVVGFDDVIYFRSTNLNQDGIAGALLTGWKIGTPFVSLPASVNPGQSAHWPHDEPVGLSAGGRYVHWNLCCDRNIGGVDISRPNTTFPKNDPARQWRYVSGALPPMRPNSMPANYWSQYPQYFWSPDAVSADLEKYHLEHADNAGPSIYDGKLFVIRSNALIAFSPTGSGASAPVHAVATTRAPRVSPDAVTTGELKAKLEDQIQKMLAAGHLRSSYAGIGLFNVMATRYAEDLLDYWHNPGENIHILLRALPHVNPTLQTQLSAYIQQEYNLFPPHSFGHIGFTTGAQREAFDYAMPPTGGPKRRMNVESFYALWKYAQRFGGAKAVFDDSKAKLGPSPRDDDLPRKHNAYIAGLVGYLELQQLAGYPQDPAKLAELGHFLDLRVQQLRWDVRYGQNPSALPSMYYSTLITAWNFLHLVPELGDHLHARALTTSQAVIGRYEHIAPYWFVGHNEEVQLENGFTPYQQTHALFQAKGLILKQSQQELAKYLDSPVVPVGDLYYIDNLVTAIEAPGGQP